MMRNKFLFLVLLGFVMLSSCSDDDKDPFKNYSADYSGDKLTLKMNGKEFAGASVAFNSLNEKNASVTLKGMVPGEPALEIKNLAVVDLGNKDFSFVGEDKNDDRTIGVEGTVKAGVLSMNTMFKVTSKVVRKWMLADYEVNSEDLTVISSPLYLNIDSDLDSITLPLMMFGGNYDPETEAPIYDKEWKLSMNNDLEIGTAGFPLFMQEIFQMIVPGLLQSIELKDDGNLIATYLPMTGLMSDDVANEPLVTEEGLVRYNVKDGNIYVLIDVASLLTPRSTNNSMDVISQMLATGIPLKLVVDEGHLRAYVDKNMMMPFMSFADLAKGAVQDMEPMNVLIGEITSATLQKFIDDVVGLVTNARAIELGLDLVPYVEDVQPEEMVSFPQAMKRTAIKFGK